MGNLVPSLLLSANRSYQLGVFKAPTLLEPQVVASPVSIPTRPDSTKTMVTSVLEIQPAIFRPADDKDPKPRFSLKASFRAQIFDQASENPLVPVLSQFFPDVETYASFFRGFPVAFPELIQRLFEYHPIPFHVLATVNVPETVEDARMDQVDKFYPQGFVHTTVEAFAHECDRYLLRQGIPCPREFVVKRYGGEYAAYDKPALPASATAEKAFLASLKAQRPAIFTKSPPVDETAMAIMEREGCACLDGPLHSEIPPLDADVDYYAVNLFPLPTPPPTKARPDPFDPDLPADCLVPAVDLTPESGAAFILASFGSKAPTTALDWLQKKPAGLPYWLFFIVRRPAATLPDTKEAEAMLRGMIFPEGPVVGIAPGAPSNLGELRRKLACEIGGVPYTTTNLKRAREADDQGEDDKSESETAERPQKRQRQADGSGAEVSEDDAMDIVNAPEEDDEDA
jgi:hypothetical protein